MGYGPLTLRFLASSSSTSPSAEYGLPFTLSTSATTDALRPSPGPRSALGDGLHSLRPFWFLPLRALWAHLLRLCPLWVLPVRLRPHRVRRFRRLHRFGLGRPCSGPQQRCLVLQVCALRPEGPRYCSDAQSARGIHGEPVGHHRSELQELGKASERARHTPAE